MLKFLGVSLDEERYRAHAHNCLNCSKVMQTVNLIAQRVVVGLVVLLGALLLVVMAGWLGYLIYGLLNPTQVRPFEDWYLGLGILSLLLMIGSVLIAWMLCLLNQCRWIPHKLGQAGIWLSTGVELSQVLFGIRVSYPARVHASLIGGLVFMSPLAAACWVSRYKSIHNHGA